MSRRSTSGLLIGRRCFRGGSQVSSRRTIQQWRPHCPYRQQRRQAWRGKYHSQGEADQAGRCRRSSPISLLRSSRPMMAVPHGHRRECLGLVDGHCKASRLLSHAPVPRAACPFVAETASAVGRVRPHMVRDMMKASSSTPASPITSSASTTGSCSSQIRMMSTNNRASARAVEVRSAIQ
jgi:hypothetical protein